MLRFSDVDFTEDQPVCRADVGRRSSHFSRCYISVQPSFKQGQLGVGNKVIRDFLLVLGEGGGDKGDMILQYFTFDLFMLSFCVTCEA